MEPDARGEEARGRLELRRDNGPARLVGTVNPGVTRCSVEGADCAGVTGAGAAGVLMSPAKLIPEKLGNWILVASKSSMGGRSSSLAEYRPPLGLTARDPAAETCTRLVTSDLARRLDFSRGALSSRIWYVEEDADCLGDGPVSMIVGTGG
jgi:hypothetical protein